MTVVSIIAIIVAAVLAKLVIDRLIFTTVRDYVKSWPELRKALLDGSWVAFSRRFGLPYAIACIAGAFIWMLAANHFIPDTEMGALLLFGPSLTLAVVGVVLGVLYVARRIADA